MKKKGDLLAFSLIVILLIISVSGILRLINNPKPNQSTPTFLKVYEDNYVRLYISYLDKNMVGEDKKTFISIRGKSSNDIMLIVENLREEGLIFTPTPIVTILDPDGEIVNNLNPYIFVAGVANSLDSTYIYFTNPVPPPTTKKGNYTYIIDLQYQHIFYDKVATTGDVSINIGVEIRKQWLPIEILNFVKRNFGIILSTTLLFVVIKRRRKR